MAYDPLRGYYDPNSTPQATVGYNPLTGAGPGITTPSPYFDPNRSTSRDAELAAAAQAEAAANAARASASSSSSSGSVTSTVNPEVVAPPPAFSALQIMENFFLNAMGLSGMGAWAADLYNRGAKPEEIVRALRYGTDTSDAGKRVREAYLAAFPGIDEFMKDGTFPGEAPELQYIQYRQTVTEAAARYGVPANLVSKEAIANMIRGHNSPLEIVERMNTAATAIASTPQETYAVLEDYYGVSSRDLMAFYLDTGPTEAELKKRYTAARIGTEAVRQQFGIDRQYAEDLATRGVTIDEANAGFGKAYQQSGFMYGKGETVGRANLAEAQFGSATSAAQVARIAAGRKAQFAGGGQFAAERTGVTGLQSAEA